jgi:hypothetical protein
MDPYVVTFYLGLVMGVIRPAFDISIVIWVPYSLLLASIESRNLIVHLLDFDIFNFIFFILLFIFFDIDIYIQGMYAPGYAADNSNRSNLMSDSGLYYRNMTD